MFQMTDRDQKGATQLALAPARAHAAPSLPPRPTRFTAHLRRLTPPGTWSPGAMLLPGGDCDFYEPR